MARIEGYHARPHFTRALLLALAVAGCGAKTTMRPGNQGILWISWTVRGQPVSDTTCKGVEHLSLTMNSGGGELQIEPIPCLRGLGWEYDGVPEGNDLVLLDGFDARGCRSRSKARATVDVTPTKAMTPTPIDLLKTR